ncbi:MAG: GerW family sporulation protein [Oscillospiraceae bacterium]|nr:GerW family sporulation protein [Oscillospiraceae bacterium]MBR2366594.1 GerW family sporulation protein [Oscillospiraceae bacterium]MBR2896803.1 GerW family sporulation protein [Oscillospiraceae bacterium]MBR2978189.1 GerW family sporulation protein [Oscillospiraceae bacterium]MBR3849542.1 GerW family sporulation protein [Oscillospiraceae bacterium]
MDNPINSMMDASLESIRKTADANTVIGDPIVTADGTTVIPVSRIKLGFAGGGSEFSGKHAGESKPYGAGTGASVTVTPVAFLIFREGSCRVLPIPEPASNSVDRLIEQIPDAVDKITTLWNERKAPAEEI